MVVPEPSKWIEIIYNGKSFIDVLEMNSDHIRKIVEDKELSEIVSEQFIRSFDLSVQQFQYDSIFGFRKRFRDIETILEVNNNPIFLMDENLLKNYQEILMEPSVYKKFMHIDNFCFSKDNSKLATKDFRVLIDDLSGSVPRDELLNVASIASLMLSGYIDYTIGYDYIIEIMKKYGYTEFTFQERGYIHIKLGDKTNEFKYRKPGDVDPNPKS